MESEVPETMKEQQDDGSSHDLGVIGIKLEPVEESLKDLDCSEYVIKNAPVETEALLEPMETEQDFEQMSEETIKGENSDTIQTTENMEDSGCAVKREVDDAEALMTPLFVPVEGEPYSEGTSEESAMEENFEATENEVILASSTQLTRYSEVESSMSETHKSISAAGLNSHAVHNNCEETTKAYEELSTQCLKRKGKSHEENSEKSTASSSACVDKEVKQDGSKLVTYKRKSSSPGESHFKIQVKEKRRKKEMQGSFSQRSSSKQKKEARKSCFCKICGERLPSADALEDHERIHTGDKHFRCALCNKTLSTKGNLVEHMRVHSKERPYKCSSCDKAFKRNSHLEKHIRIHKGEKPFECNVCGKAFTQNCDLIRHMRIHNSEKPYKCAVCRRKFSDSSHLNKHMRIHSGDKPYVCTECGKAFSQSGDLTRHVRTHTGVKPYSCTDCGKNFTQSHQLTVHMRLHTGEKPYRCNECGKAFSDSGQLTTHMRLHTGEKPFTCTECGKTFSAGGNLIQHMRTHTGKKPYRCTECRKEFSHSYSLTIHKRVHTGERPFACSVCGSGFYTSSSLSRHKALRHRAVLECLPEQSTAFCERLKMRFMTLSQRSDSH